MSRNTEFIQSVGWALFFTVALTGVVWAEDVDPPWQQPSSWPDRIVATLDEDPQSSFRVNWRTDNSVSSAVAQIAPASAAARFDVQAKEFAARSERFEFDPKWVEGKRGGDTNNLVIDPVMFHSIRFSGLEPDTLYAYRVGGAEGQWSAWHQLRTAPASGPFEFLVLGDAQNSIRSHISRIYQAASIAAPEKRFMIHLGDLVTSGINDRLWAEWFVAGGNLLARVPSAPVPGNHDYLNQGGSYKKMLTPLWRPQFNLPVTPGLPEHLAEAVYAIPYNQDLLLIGLDSTANGFDQQLDWAAQVMINSKARWKIMYMHHPYSSWVGVGQEKPDQAVKRAQFDEFLDKYHVDLVLTGHRHSYQRAERGPGVHGRDKRQPYPVNTVLMTTASTIKRGETKVAGWEKFSQERDGKISLTRWGDYVPLFAVIRLDGSVLEYRALDAVGRVYDEFTVNKDSTGQNTIENGPATFGEVFNRENSSMGLGPEH